MASPEAQPADLVGALVPALLSLPTAQQLEALHLAVRAFDGRRRGELLRALEALAPIIAALGGDGAVTDAADAVVTTGRWFP
jgi:hypothetical protein